MMKRLIALALFGLIGFAGIAGAQNLLDNSAYKKAVGLRDQAQSAFAAGNYDQATKLSAEAEVYAGKAVDLARELALGYRAVNLLGIAKARIQFGESVSAATRYPSEWKTAQLQIGIAQKDYGSRDYENSMTASRAVLTALKNIAPPTATLVSHSQQVLPEYYIVRLLPNHRDCFWTIAGYPFVYNNPYDWRILYRANRNVLQDPSNPNLIQPGMVFRIPSIHGEMRRGTYDPNGK